MKFTIVIALLAGCLVLTSCNKEGDWKCTCNIDGKETETITYDTKKKDARKKCQDLENNKLYDIKGCRLSGKE